jgi:hypothetical protein
MTILATGLDALARALLDPLAPAFLARRSL